MLRNAFIPVLIGVTSMFLAARSLRVLSGFALTPRMDDDLLAASFRR